jgi:membrane associated rhomboid family serine protease
MKNFISGKLYLLLLVTNVLVFLLFQISVGFTDPSNLQLLDWGANFAPLTLTGEPWRLVTSAFMHGGWVHLVGNMSMLLVFGGVLEHKIGSWRFAAVYWLCALGGSLWSAYWSGHVTVTRNNGFMGIDPVLSLGASGALMGLAGAALYMLVYESMDPMMDGEEDSISFSSIAQVIGINLVIGFLVEGVDQAAHIGGLVVGFVTMACIYSYRAMATPVRRIAVPITVTVLLTAFMVNLALRGQTGDLLRWKDNLSKERMQSRQ